MFSQNATRIKLLKIWEILCQETDEEHPMESLTLIEKLAEMGIPCTRKTLYTDIQILNDCGYEVICSRKKKNEYYVIDAKVKIKDLLLTISALRTV